MRTVMKIAINFLKNIWNFISYAKIQDTEKVPIKDFDILLNRYLAVLSVIFFFHSVTDYLVFNKPEDAFVLISLSLLSVILIFFFTHLRKNKIFLCFIFLFLGQFISHYSHIFGIESGIFLFYFPLLSAVPILFTIKKDQLYVIAVGIYITVRLYLSAVNDFRHASKYFLQPEYNFVLLIMNISFLLLLSALNFYIFHEKVADYYAVINRNRYKKAYIENLSIEIGRLKKLLAHDHLNEESLKDLIYSIQLSDVIFVKKIERFFPDFFNKINEQVGNSLSLAEMKFCGMMKLGFNTKQIANYTHSSVKSVEAKKYRLRKKLKNYADSKDWFLDL